MSNKNKFKYRQARRTLTTRAVFWGLTTHLQYSRLPLLTKSHRYQLVIKSKIGTCEVESALIDISDLLCHDTPCHSRCFSYCCFWHFISQYSMFNPQKVVCQNGELHRNKTETSGLCDTNLKVLEQT